MDHHSERRRSKRILESHKRRAYLSKRLRRSSTPWLPLEVVIEILARISVKRLQRFRCVCRSWNSIIAQDAHLVSLHLRNRIRHPNNIGGVVGLLSRMRAEPKHPHGPLDVYYSKPIMSYSAGDDYSRPVEFDLGRGALEMDRLYYWLTNSCDGLIGVFSINSFYIANPSIKKLTALPRATSQFHILEAGIGFDASSGEYKAVRLFEYGDKRVSKGCELCTLGGPSRCWKLVGDAPFLPYQREMTEGCYGFPPVVVDGAIHWTVLLLEHPDDSDDRAKPEIALSFNLRDEKFGVIVHPEGSSRPMLSRVAALGGHLCVVDTQYDTMRMDVWVLKDYGNRRWAKQYSICLLKMYRTAYAVEDALPVTVRSDGIVVWCDGWGRRRYFDPRTRKFVMHKFVHDRVRFEQLVAYTESLVWPWLTGTTCAGVTTCGDS